MDNGKIEEVVEIADESIRIYTKHLEYLRKVIGWSKNAKETLQNISPYLDYADFDELISMHSFNSLLTIAMLDLLVICKKLATADNDWEKVFFIKQGYLTIYETIDTYNSHNQQIKKLIDTKFTGLKNDYLSVSASLKQFKKDYLYQDNIKNVRNIIAGHINKDFVFYYDTLLKIEGQNESNAILAFIAVLKKIENLSFDMEMLSQKYVAEQLEKEGMGKTIDEISLNFDKKFDAFKILVAEKRTELEEYLKAKESVEST